MRTYSGRELCVLLGAHGFVIVRQKGSHIIMQNRTGSSTITVPVPDHHEVKAGTLMSIIRQSGLPKTLFE